MKIDNDCIQRIEKAFGFPLYEWQKEYLLAGGSWRKGGRATGHTFAYCIRFLLSDGEKIKVRDLSNYTDRYPTANYIMWFKQYICEINQVLIHNGFETRLKFD